MQFFEYETKKIAYKIDNENHDKTIVLLNGIMMSIGSWDKFIPQFAKNRKVIRIDFLDQGQSSKMSDEYGINMQADVVLKLMDYLNVSKFDLFGISYGAHVSLITASISPKRVGKLMVFNALTNTSNQLRDIGISWKLPALANNPEQFYYASIPTIYSTDFYNNNEKWFEDRKSLLLSVFTKDYLYSMARLISSSESYDVRENLQKITADTLVVGTTFDMLTPCKFTKNISNGIMNSKYIEIPDCGHATMYEKPNEFMSIISGFMDNDEIKII
ncbi:MAG: alpha/beta fold hydrolase [Lachnospirales bacterium]